MRARRLSCVLLLLVPLALPMTAAGAPAKARQPAAPAQPADSVDLFAGFSYTHSGEASLYGVDLSASLPLRRGLRVVLDLSKHSGSFAGVDLSQLTFLAGPRYVFGRHGRLRPFAQALVGGVHTKSSFVDTGGTTFSDSSTGWGGAAGGGLDYRLSRRWAARGQADLLLFHSGGVWDSDPRLSAGVVYRFGR